MFELAFLNTQHSALSTQHSISLAFGFFNPAFAWAGLAVVSIPIIIHLLNRRRFRTVTWAAMEFLLRAMKKNRRRLRFEQWLLLLTRCLLIFLIGMALAQFAGCNTKSTGSSIQRPKEDVYIIDNSYSTSYTRDPADADAQVLTHLDKAKQLARQWLAEGNKSVIITTAKPAAIVSDPESKAEVSINAVNQIEQTWGAADLKKAMGLALEVAGKDKNNDYDKRLFIITHSTKSKWDISDAKGLKQLGAQLASQFTQITPVNLADQQNAQWNGAIFDIEPTSHLVSAKLPVGFRADVRSFFSKGDQPERGHDAKVTWTLDDQPRGDRPMKLDGAPNPVPQTLSDITFDHGGFHVLTARIDDPGDHLSVDNARHRVIDVASDLKILLVEGTSGGDEFGGVAHYFETAIKLKDSHYSPEKITPSELRQKALVDYRAIALVNVPEISAEESDDLATFVHQGGALFIFMGGAVKQNEYNANLFERHALLPGKLINAMSYHREEFTLDFAKGVTGGDFRLSFNGVSSSPIPYSTDSVKTAASIQSEVKKLTGIPGATAVPSGGNLEYTIAFMINGAIDALPQETATADGGGLHGDKAVTIGAGKLAGSRFDFKPNSVLHPLLKAFANHDKTGLDDAETDKYWQVDPDLLIETVKAMRDTQSHINEDFAASAADSKPLSPQLILDQTKLAGQVKDLVMTHRELTDAPASARDPASRVPGAVTRLLSAASAQKPFAREDQNDVRVLLDGIFKRLESTRAERVLNYLPMKGGGTVDPAITAQTVGRGRVVFISTSANREWTRFPDNLSFPPLMFELLDGSLRSRDAWMNLTVGDHLAIPANVWGKTFTLTKDGTAPTKITVHQPERDFKSDSANSPAGESPEEEWRALYHTDPLTQPGKYTLAVENRTMPIVVNVPAPLEADVTTVDNEAIGHALGGVKMEERVAISNPDRDYYGWLTLIAVLMLAGFECFIASRFGHTRQPETVAGAAGAGQVQGSSLGGPAPAPGSGAGI
jgi:hypothetical protein